MAGSPAPAAPVALAPGVFARLMEGELVPGLVGWDTPACGRAVGAQGPAGLLRGRSGQEAAW